MEVAGGLVGIGIVGRVLQRQQKIDIQGKVVLITGGSRGFGLAMAEEFAREGARLVLCARDEEELLRAQSQIKQLGAEVITFPCDVAQPAEVEQVIAQATAHFGAVDVLVNNAGIISAGPWQTLTRADFEQSMNIMFWGTYNMTMAVVPQMRARKSGRIVNITSIGGKVSVPHLLAYSSAKFATAGFSEGMRAELAKDGVCVTTVVPGLMRTGSQVNTTMKGESHRIEYSLFTLLDTLPLFSISAQRAAQYVVQATKKGSAEIIITLPAQLLARLNGAFPELVAPLMSLSTRFLPSGDGKGTESYSGRESETAVTRSFITSLGQKALTRL
ncbi:SDR family NAD(P)-dependent oxidoreductase [Dictyobacter kobayashii]|uniref:SDR family NAD(P)-dependent oxidoreductase n=1 Tax=Dictyobacter kobayashii TaxID=2014872 RepID=UPI001C3FB168|nr:SDR family NAD(P)-dependent oxidoreductase [Dictyobacter kobayashii]